MRNEGEGICIPDSANEVVVSALLSVFSLQFTDFRSLALVEKGFEWCEQRDTNHFEVCTELNINI